MCGFWGIAIFKSSQCDSNVHSGLALLRMIIRDMVEKSMVSWRSMEGRRDDSEDQCLLERHLAQVIANSVCPQSIVAFTVVIIIIIDSGDIRSIILGQASSSFINFSKGPYKG